MHEGLRQFLVASLGKWDSPEDLWGLLSDIKPLWQGDRGSASMENRKERSGEGW